MSLDETKWGTRCSAPVGTLFGTVALFDRGRGYQFAREDALVGPLLPSLTRATQYAQAKGWRLTLLQDAGVVGEQSAQPVQAAVLPAGQLSVEPKPAAATLPTAPAAPLPPLPAPKPAAPKVTSAPARPRGRAKRGRGKR